jgi:uncharacterized protein YkwD
VRDTPKLLLATLITLLLSLVGPAAGPAAARQRNAPHQHGNHSAKGSHRSAGRHTEGHSQDRANRRAARQQASANRRAQRRQAREDRRADREHPTPAPSSKLDSAPSGAASVAAVLATPCQDTGLTPTGENQARVRASVLCLINRVRAEHNLQPLGWNPELEDAAEGHCSELIADDYFAHVSPSGETPVDRIKATGYIPSENVGYVIGENLAWGTYSLSTPQAIVEAWVASPGHLANILESRYTETGIGVIASVPESLGEGNPGATYAEEFGVIVH